MMKTFANPQNRPSSKELSKIIEEWQLKLEDDKLSKISQEFFKADEIFLPSTEVEITY